MSQIFDYQFIAEPGQLSVVQTCLINTSLENVFQCFIDPHLIPKCWGPASMNTVVEVLDAEPGGKWRYIQTDSSGEIYSFHGYFHLVQPPNKVIYTFSYEGEADHIGLEEITLLPEHGMTRITDVTVFLHQSVRDSMVNYGMESGARETFERIAALFSKRDGSI